MSLFVNLFVETQDVDTWRVGVIVAVVRKDVLPNHVPDLPRDIDKLAQTCLDVSHCDLRENLNSWMSSRQEHDAVARMMEHPWALCHYLFVFGYEPQTYSQ